MASPNESEDPLAAYPAEVRQAAQAFATSRSSADFLATLHGILRFHRVVADDSTPPPEPAVAPKDTSLLDGLGLDSLAMAELAFLLEDLWAVHLTDEELREIATLGQIEAVLAERLNVSS